MSKKKAHEVAELLLNYFSFLVILIDSPSEASPKCLSYLAAGSYEQQVCWLDDKLDKTEITFRFSLVLDSYFL